MYQNTPNVIQRARNRKGLTQEALAFECGYSDDSIRAWESGARTASMEALNILAGRLDAPWLPIVYMQERTTVLNALLPEFSEDKPLSETAAAYVSYIFEFVDERFDRKLLRMVADGRIDEVEAPVYREMLALGEQITKAYFEMRFSAGGLSET